MRSICAAVLLVGSSGCLWGQVIEDVKPMAADAHPSFEVASVRRSDPSDQKHRFAIEGHRITLENQTVQTMIEMAYGVHARQIVNAPSWIGTERFDVVGIPDVEGEPNVVQFKEMVKKLLTERFGLKLRSEKKEMARYTLTVGKSGPKMAPTKSAPDALPEENGDGNRTTMTLRMTNVSMGELARNLQAALDRPVVDETGLKGKYDFVLNWARVDAVPVDDDSSLAGLFTAIQEQLGLKLEPDKGEVQVLVVEGVERPDLN